jgi:hypothetical protein
VDQRWAVAGVEALVLSCDRPRFGCVASDVVLGRSQTLIEIAFCEVRWPTISCYGSGTDKRFRSVARIRNGTGRDVDIHPLVAKMLREYIGNRKSGFLFETETGNMLWPSTLYPDGLKTILKGIGRGKVRFHAFRRFG